MKVTNIKNSYSEYSECTHYMRTSNKFLKSMRIAQKMLNKIYPDFKLSFCETIFPRYDSNLFLVEKLKVKIVFEKSTLKENLLYFSFVI